MSLLRVTSRVAPRKGLPTPGKKNLDPTKLPYFFLQPKHTTQHKMADYDSDSSDGEFTETNILLGYASKDVEEDTISKLGGRPVRPRTPSIQCAMSMSNLASTTGMDRSRYSTVSGPCSLQSLQRSHGSHLAAKC